MNADICKRTGSLQTRRLQGCTRLSLQTRRLQGVTRLSLQTRRLQGSTRPSLQTTRLQGITRLSLQTKRLQGTTRAYPVLPGCRVLALTSNIGRSLADSFGTTVPIPDFLASDFRCFRRVRPSKLGYRCILSKELQRCRGAGASFCREALLFMACKAWENSVRSWPEP